MFSEFHEICSHFVEFPKTNSSNDTAVPGRPVSAVAGQQPVAVCKQLPAVSNCSRVERFDRRPIEPFELFTSEFGQNSVRIQENSSTIFRKFLKFENSQHFLKYSAKLREIFVRIGAKFDEKVLKTSDFTEI